MSGLLDWITLNPWAVALAAVAFACAGYALTRPVALRGSASTDDPTIWVAVCMGLYPDTRKGAGDDDQQESVEGAESNVDPAGDGGGE